MRKLALAALLLLAPRSASAVGAVIGDDVTEVRVAIVAQGARQARWYSISTAGDAPLVWVIPVGREAAVDAASNAWLESLDVITAPRVAPSCGSERMEIVRAVRSGPDPAPPVVTLVRDASELAREIDPAAPRLAELEAALGAHDLAIVRAKGPAPATVRVVDRDASIAIPTSLLRPSRAVDVTAFVIGDRRASLGSIAPEPSPLRWYGQVSDWRLRRDAALSAAGPLAFVTEYALAGSALSARRISPSTIPPLAFEYFSRAPSIGAASSCANAAAMIGDALAPMYCARAELAGRALEPCTYSSALACGSRADDLALALGGREPNKVWITRLFGRVRPSDPALDLSPTELTGAEVSPLRVALAPCGDLLDRPSDPGSNPGSTWGGSGGCGGSVDTTSSGVDCSADDADTGEGGCGASADGADDGCSGSSGGASADDCDSGTNAGDSCDSGGSDSCSSGSSDCDASHRAHHRGKSPLSRALLAFAFVALPLRRLSGSRGQRGARRSSRS